MSTSIRLLRAPDTPSAVRHIASGPMTTEGEARAAAARAARAAAISIETLLLDTLPSMRAYARFLAGNRPDADDLVHDTVVRILGAAGRFEAGTNFKAWAFTILRNRFLSGIAGKKRRHVSLDDVDADIIRVGPLQEEQLELQDLARQFMRLSPQNRSVLALVADKNMTYEQIAEISGCAVGTVKSRVHRARILLREMLRTAYATPPETVPEAMPEKTAEPSLEAPAETLAETLAVRD